MVTYTNFNKVVSDKYGLLAHGLAFYNDKVTIPAGTIAGSRFRAFRFKEGFTLTDFTILTDDLDTGTAVTISVGYVYDAGQTDNNDVALVDDEDYFIDNNTSIGQAEASFAYPSNSSSQNVGKYFTAEGSGYIVVEITGGPTTTAGTIEVGIGYTYNKG